MSINEKLNRFEELTTDEMFDVLEAAYDELIAETAGARRINADFVILHAQAVTPMTEIVFGQRESDGEYVTWMCMCGTDYNWGHYFGPEQLLEAMADFVRRCAQ